MVVKKTKKTGNKRRKSTKKTRKYGTRRSRKRFSLSKYFKLTAKRKKQLKWAAKWLTVMFIWGSFCLIGMIMYLAADLPPIESAVDFDRRPTIILLAANGDEIARYGDLQGDPIAIKDMSPHLPNAVIATEDRRFYYHFGLDPIGLARAMAANLRAGHVVQGGSTITQQLAKNLFLTPERTLIRKAKEAILALYLEHNYTKDEILEAYLNRAYFGAGAYGVDAAARIYFNKSASEVNLEEAALLAGLLRAPSKYSPSNSPVMAAERAQVVLGAMVDAGYLTKGTEKIKITPLPQKEYARGGSSDMRYFTDWVVNQIDAYVGKNDQDLIVQTTLNPYLQREATLKIKATLTENGEERNIGQAALITMEPNGAVRALVGGKDYHESQFNRATQARRQPGSAFKPFVYLTAMEKGFSPLTIVDDKPVKFGSYAPTNFKGEYLGEIPLSIGLAFSVNTAAVQVLDAVSVDAVIETAHRLGITEDLNRDLSLALGTSEVSLINLTSAYAAFANGGYAIQPFGILEIRSDDGRLIYKRPNFPGTRVIESDALAYMNVMLQGVVEHGTGQAARLTRDAAGKTGTSQDFRDALFVGYTADYVTGVWVGNDNNASMDHVTGGSIPARLWKNFMTTAHASIKPRPLPGSELVDLYLARSAGDDAHYRVDAERRYDRNTSSYRKPVLEDVSPDRRGIGGTFRNMLDRLVGDGASLEQEDQQPAQEKEQHGAVMEYSYPDDR